MKILALLTLTLFASTTVHATGTATFKLDADHLSCTKGTLTYFIQGERLPTVFQHTTAKATFKGQYECYKFVVEAIDRLGTTPTLTYEAPYSEQRYRSQESYEYDCRYYGGGMAGPREHCRRGSREVERLTRNEQLKISILDVEFSSVAQDTRKI